MRTHTWRSFLFFFRQAITRNTLKCFLIDATTRFAVIQFFFFLFETNLATACELRSSSTSDYRQLREYLQHLQMKKKSRSRLSITIHSFSDENSSYFFPLSVVFWLFKLARYWLQLTNNPLFCDFLLAHNYFSFFSSLFFFLFDSRRKLQISHILFRRKIFFFFDFLLLFFTFHTH